MSTGEADVERRRSAARSGRIHRAAFPALVLALALFCVEGLQLLSSVVRDDLSSPPLVEVPPIDLRSSPPPAPRPTVVAGAVVDVVPAEAAPVEAAAAPDAAPEESPAAAPAAEPAPAAPASRPLDVPAPVLPAPVAAVVPAPAGPELAAAAEEADRKRRGVPGPPAGRPVGPECGDVPGTRTACDRRPPLG